jgi:glycosyltransferase involved in cell wall biosynthesis
VEDIRMPQTSVVVPTHDRSRLLALTLRSVLWQREVDLEVVVVDDGSADDTAEVVAGLADPRVRLVRHATPQGVSAARNRGAAEARGAWVAFLDDDDLWAPDKLARQLDAARATGRTWAYAGAVKIDDRQRIVGGTLPPSPEQVVARLPRHNAVPGGCSGALVTSRLLAETGPFDPELGPMADWDLWIRLARTGPPACSPRPLVAYRVHGSNMSLDTTRMEAEFAVVASRSGAGSHAIFFRYLGWWCVRVRNHRRALAYFIRAVRQRDAAYRAGQLRADLSYLAGDFLSRVRGRLGWHAAPRAADRKDQQEHQEWRADAQRWIDDLIAV